MGWGAGGGRDRGESLRFCCLQLTDPQGEGVGNAISSPSRRAMSTVYAVPSKQKQKREIMCKCKTQRNMAVLCLQTITHVILCT